MEKVRSERGMEMQGSKQEISGCETCLHAIMISHIFIAL